MRRLLAVVAVAALLATPAAAAAGPEFGKSIYTVRQGETVEMGISLADGETATVTVGNESDTNFELRATVADENGDGEVALRFDASAAADGPGAALSVGDGDAITETTEVAGVEGDLQATSYGLAIGPVDDPDSIATLAVQRGVDYDVSAARNGTTIDHEGEELTVESAPDQRITGETTVDPGTTLSVRIKSASSESPFLLSAEAPVAEDGSFAATADFSSVSPGTPFEVSVRDGTTELAHATGRVGDCEGSCPTAAGDQSGEDTTRTPLDASEVNVASVVTIDGNETARVPVTFGDSDALTVSVGDEDVNYGTTAVVRDTNGDGRAVVLVRTDAADDAETPVLAVEESGEVRPVNVTSGRTLDAPLDPAEYDLSVHAGTTADGNPATVGTLVVADGDGTGDAGTDADDASPGTVAATDSSAGRLSGFGALALGGLLAVGGVAVFVGFARR